MLYTCTEADRSRILAYIAKEPEMNLFFFGDIENFGVDQDPVHIYAFADTDNNWQSLLLQYFDSYIFYSQDVQCPADEAVTFLKSRKVDCLSGKLELVKRFSESFPDKKLQPTFMSRCNTVSHGVPLPANVTLRKLTPEDFVELLELLSGIAEFADSFRDPQRARKQQEVNYRHGSVTYGVYTDGKLAATAATTADSSQSAMVMAVATRPELRGHGYASAAVTRLCEDCFAVGKNFLCLFYDNPAAGRIYHRVGFQDVGSYAMLQ